MFIGPAVRSLIYQCMWDVLKIGRTDAESVIANMEKEDHFPDKLVDEGDVSTFVKGNLQKYLYPNSLSRLKVYDQKFLDDNNIVLDFISIIPDGWDCHLYFDKKNGIYWEDHFGRYSKEGFKISPYVNPIEVYKKP